MKKRTGRRPVTEAGEPREAILRAARALFARDGFRGTTMRAVAGASGVDAALVAYYFGSKQGLFQAALDLPFDPREVFPRVLAGPHEEMGERLVRFFLATWSAQSGAGALPALVRTVVNEPAAADLLERLLVREGLGAALAAVGVDEPDLRAALVASQLVGIGMLRFVLRIEPLASEPEERLVAGVAPVVQRYLTGPLPRRRMAANRDPGHGGEPM